MKTAHSALLLSSLLLASACGGPDKPADEPTASEGEEAPKAAKKGDKKDAKTAEGSPDAAVPETGPCIDLTYADFAAAAAQAECEVADAQPDQHQMNVSDLLDIKITASPNVIKPGGHVDVTVTIRNKSKAMVPLFFAVDPEPRFSFETYTSKGGTRADAPKKAEPQLPAEVAGTEPERKYSRLKLLMAGTATYKTGWDAIKYDWAPKAKAKGAIPGHGYPKVPAGPLAKGKYRVKLVMPLVGIVEGIDHEVTAPSFEVEVK